MAIDYNQLESAINESSHSEVLNKYAIEILNEHQDHHWIGIYNACCYLFHFNSETGEYDKIIIEGFENAFAAGLNIKSNPSYFLNATKTLARLYFKYSSFRKASSSLLMLTENTDPTDLPDWVYNYSAKVDIHTEIDYYLLEPHKLLKKIPLVGQNDRQRISIYKEFLLAAYNHFKKNGNASTSTFIEKAMPYIVDNLELFDDEWQALKGLIVKAVPEDLMQVDVSELLIANVNLQEDNEELRQLVVELENELTKLRDENEKLSLVQKKQTEDYKQMVDSIRKSADTQDMAKVYQPKLLVLGASDVQDYHIYKTAETNFNISRENIDINNDYKKNKRYNIKTLQYNSKYDGIMIGPIAHKVCGMGDNSSVIQALSREGFPPIVEVRAKSGKLKITKTSIKEAMKSLLIKVYSNIPSG